MKLAKFAAAAAIAFGSVAGAGVAHAAPVALQLALVIDVSGSVDASEYNLQLDGYRDAFQSAAIGGAIASFAGQGGVAVGVYMFASTTQQVLGWTQLSSAADASAFGTSIGSIVRPPSANVGILTNIASGIDAAVAGMASNGFTSSRRIIDVSGDGQQSTTRDGGTQLSVNDEQAVQVLEAARDDADALGIIINGLAILNQAFPTLDAYYDDHMRTGAGSFVLSATFDTFAEAIETKIGREILNVPEPGSLALALVGVALAGLGFMRRRRVA